VPRRERRRKKHDRQDAHGIVRAYTRAGAVVRREEPELYAYLSGWEYLEMVGTLRAMERAQMTKKIDALLALFSLAPYRHSSIGSYSKGMRQRILLIAALLHDPEILILDEPLSGLDVVSAMIVKSLIKTLGERV
jgi:ABC-2 type transport system ATP-binding protein